jgi:hypothetical protein
VHLLEEIDLRNPIDHNGPYTYDDIIAKKINEIVAAVNKMMIQIDNLEAGTNA